MHTDRRKEKLSSETAGDSGDKKNARDKRVRREPAHALKHLGKKRKKADSSPGDVDIAGDD